MSVYKTSKIPYDESVLTVIHDLSYIDQVKKACANGDSLDGDTRTSVKSYEAAVVIRPRVVV